MVWYGVVYFIAVWYGMENYGTIQNSFVRYIAAGNLQYSTVQYIRVQLDMARHGTA